MSLAKTGQQTCFQVFQPHRTVGLSNANKSTLYQIGGSLSEKLYLEQILRKQAMISFPIR